MNIRSINVGDKRFLLHIRFNGWKDTRPFRKWMAENYPHCMCVSRYDNFGSDTYLEVRGSDITIPMMIKLVWGGTV